MIITKKEIIVKCCLCLKPIEIDDLYDHTIEHLKDEIAKKNMLLELRVPKRRAIKNEN